MPGAHYPIDYGEADRVAELLYMIARREGIGDVLAEGIVHASKLWGLEEIAVHVKGLEPAGYVPRTLKGMGIELVYPDGQVWKTGGDRKSGAVSGI